MICHGSMAKKRNSNLVLNLVGIALLLIGNGIIMKVTLGIEKFGVKFTEQTLFGLKNM